MRYDEIIQKRTPKIGAKSLANALKTKAKHKSLSKSCKMVPLFCLFVQIAALSIKANRFWVLVNSDKFVPRFF